MESPSSFLMALLLVYVSPSPRRHRRLLLQLHLCSPDVHSPAHCIFELYLCSRHRSLADYFLVLYATHRRRTRYQTQCTIAPTPVQSSRCLIFLYTHFFPARSLVPKRCAPARSLPAPSSVHATYAHMHMHPVLRRPCLTVNPLPPVHSFCT